MPLDKMPLDKMPLDKMPLDKMTCCQAKKEHRLINKKLLSGNRVYPLVNINFSIIFCSFLCRLSRHDIQHNDTQHNDTQNNDNFYNNPSV
jgi:hypothetical protein